VKNGTGEPETGQDRGRRQPLLSLPYFAVCGMLGAALGWAPMLLHGPIPEKFTIYYLDGSSIVWAFYTARLSVGIWVGITTTPRRWYLRGPLCGFLALLPVTFVALGTPGCGFT
jgi:hypothetical protein